MASGVVAHLFLVMNRLQRLLMTLMSLTFTKRRRVTKLVENPEQNRKQSSKIGTNVLVWH